MAEEYDPGPAAPDGYTREQVLEWVREGEDIRAQGGRAWAAYEWYSAKDDPDEDLLADLRDVVEEANRS